VRPVGQECLSFKSERLSHQSVYHKCRGSLKKRYLDSKKRAAIGRPLSSMLSFLTGGLSQSDRYSAGNSVPAPSLPLQC
jgi:hypothetical protein